MGETPFWSAKDLASYLEIGLGAHIWPTSSVSVDGTLKGCLQCKYIVILIKKKKNNNKKTWEHILKNYHKKINRKSIFEVYMPVGLVCKICWLYLCGGMRTPLQTNILDMTLNYLMVRLQFKTFGKMWSTPSLPLLLGPLWPWVVVPVRVLSKGQIDQLNYLLYMKPFNCVQTND